MKNILNQIVAGTTLVAMLFGIPIAISKGQQLINEAKNRTVLVRTTGIISSYLIDEGNDGTLNSKKIGAPLRGCYVMFPYPLTEEDQKFYDNSKL